MHEFLTTILPSISIYISGMVVGSIVTAFALAARRNRRDLP